MGSEESAQNEVEIMKDLYHKNIIRMFGSFVDIDFGRKDSREQPTSAKAPAALIKIKQD
jgi:serine/threonine protein kinase